MIVGVPKEIKTREYRVGLVPGGAAALKLRGHTVLVEKGAGLGSGLPDELYVRAGAQIVDSAEEVWRRAELSYGEIRTSRWTPPSTFKLP